MAIIYGLFDPRHQDYIWDVRYIGRTIQSLSDRLNGHLTDGRNPVLTRDVSMWISELLQDGHSPVIRQFECCSDIEIGAREQTWIAEGNRQGWSLLNEYNASKYTPRGPSRRMPIEDRFWPKVDIKSPDECWGWLAYVNPTSGRPYFHIGSRFTGDARDVPASRVSWELTNGPIPNGLHVLHKCDNGECVNPHHLFLGTHADNMRDCSEKGRQRNQNNDKTHCKRGHEFTEENTHWRTPTKRKCRTCGRDHMRLYRAKKKAA